MNTVKQSSVYRLALTIKLMIGREVLNRLEAKKALNKELGTSANYDVKSIIMAVAVKYAEHQKARGKAVRFSGKCAVAYCTQLLDHMIEEYNNPKVDPRKVQWQKIADKFGEQWVTYNYTEANAIGLQHSWN